MQAYGGSYSSVTSFGNIRNEIGAMRFPCSEIAIEKQILAPTVPQSVHANDLSLEICVFLVVKSLHSLKLLDVLPSLFENVVNSGLT